MHKFRLGYEAKFYFDWDYFSDLIMSGKWDDADKYLSGFIQLDHNSVKDVIRSYFEIRKQKYFEAIMQYLYLFSCDFFFSVLLCYLF